MGTQYRKLKNLPQTTVPACPVSDLKVEVTALECAVPWKRGGWAMMLEASCQMVKPITEAKQTGCLQNLCCISAYFTCSSGVLHPAVARHIRILT